MMLTHDVPRIEGYDQDRMAAGLLHNDRRHAALLGELRLLRELNVSLYRRTRGPDRERTGMHTERGPESVGLTVRLLAGHDLRHMDQIERTLNEVGG